MTPMLLGLTSSAELGHSSEPMQALEVVGNDVRSVYSVYRRHLVY